jgi:glycosyltransferase involved in cell wall biosynthesis
MDIPRPSSSGTPRSGGTAVTRAPDAWRALIIPTHPGVQYHLCRVGLPTAFLGHWDQFQYWRPKPPNVRNLLPAFADAQLDWGPVDYGRILDEGTYARCPDDYDFVWLMFNWQFKLFRGRREVPKVYRVAKVQELTRGEWEELLSRDDFTVVSFYRNTVDWVREHFGTELPYVPLGLDASAYGGYTGEANSVLSVIHSYRDRGWRWAEYIEATRDLPAVHVDHLDPAKPVQTYADLQRAFRRARVYLHDGEQEYTITLIEAMMTGMPLVSFAVPGIERYVVHGHNGFVGRTAVEIREYCRLLLADADLAHAMGAASRAMAEREYDERRWRADWIRIIDGHLRAYHDRQPKYAQAR